MLTNTERLLEAISYASDNGLNWHDMFDTVTDAIRTIRLALKERPDEEHIICLLASLDLETDTFEDCTPAESYERVLKQMYKELRELNNY